MTGAIIKEEDTAITVSIYYYRIPLIEPRDSVSNLPTEGLCFPTSCQRGAQLEYGI